ncbi:unnamed protein product [Lactuca virosa]|uniref:F-box associated domain-containing protein n=1 Tax=Lactuca virosa TaxID=75947 RepID=A0AAU9PFS5_9ASTR|nr:unnamed protein product [Lactuca virosa]
MAKTRSMNRNQNQDDNDNASSSSSRKRLKSFDKGDVGYWSDLNHDVLFLVIMQLGFVDFFAFNEVCKSQRSLALSERNIYLDSIPPMSISTSINKQDRFGIRRTLKEKKLKTIVPDSAGRICIGLTCGYLILFGRETNDFWLVNLITRYELYFPNYPLYLPFGDKTKAILVFLPSLSGWLFLVLRRKISFCIEGKRGWNLVSSGLPILDFHAFKGKIYTLHTDLSVSELILNPNGKRKWMLFESKNFTKSYLSLTTLVKTFT